MRRKIVHLTSVHAPFDNRIFYKECASLASTGYEVTLIAALAGGDLVRDGVQLRAVKPPRNRFQRFTRTIPRVLVLAFQQDAEVYHYHDPELMIVGAALKLWGRKVIYDVHEDYSGSMTGKQWIPASLRVPLSIAVRVCEKIFTGTCDRVVAATPAIAGKFNPPKVRLVQNYPWLEELRGAVDVPYEQREPIVVYVGALSDDRGLREMTQAIETLAKRRPARLVIAGQMTRGARAAAVEKRTSPVEHLGHQNRQQVLQLLARARVGIVTLHPTKNYLSSQPTKLYEYMSAGLPVIASDFPAWRNVVQSAGCGLLVDPLDVCAIADAMEWMLNHPAEAEAMGRAGRRAVEQHYNWEREAQVLDAMYAELTAAPAAGMTQAISAKESGS